MKTFSSLKEEVKPQYELKDSLRNEIYSLIENSISIKISNEESLDKDININGKDELVEKIKNLIDDVRVKERTFTLETVKANVYRNFDMRWLNEEIDNLKKLKVGSKLILTENIKDPDYTIDEPNDNFKTKVIDYFAKKLNEDKKIGDFEFDYDPSEGIFKFVYDDQGIIVKATPFYNDHSGFPIEVFDENQTDSHIFIEQRAFNVEEILFPKYKEILEKFLIDDYDSWIKKVNKYDEKDKNVEHTYPNAHREPSNDEPFMPSV